ncbi:MAG TPA: 1-phosphofructokinase family hexose kinase [Pseudothermotoga sp.]|nr:1-phosphofructokinase family hexose kinase [Pseudothermotoga sp.]HOK82887.1 1-phosphofructokinase family hexose kinase [Pseudothermotoga sp.]HPP69940.1 1-phosphofructokinase family hexose kinase [Pseudothermotoga sp.]
MKVITVTLNPALDREFIVEDFRVNELHRVAHYKDIMMSPGGKGINVSIALAKLRVQSVAIGILGGYIGRVLLAELNKISPLISTSFVHIDQETRENISVVDPKNHTLTEVNSPGPIVEKHALDLLLKRYEIFLSRAEIVVLSGSLPPNLKGDFYGALAKIAKQREKRVFMEITDEYIKPALEIQVPDVIKPDVREKNVVLERELVTLDDYIEAATELVKMGCKMSVISYQVKSDVVATNEGVWLITTPGDVEISNLLGAGDAYVAAMAYKMLSSPKNDLLETAKFGYAAALAKTRKLPKEMPDYDEIVNHLQSCQIERLR